MKRNVPAKTNFKKIGLWQFRYRQVSLSFHFGSVILMFSIYEATEAHDHLKSLFQLTN